MSPVIGEYNSILVVFSVLIATISSYAALLIVRRMMHSEKSNQRVVWLCIGSVIFGAGIWSMHFVAMLAYDMGMVVSYNRMLLALSILFAAASSFTAFFLLTKTIKRGITLPIGALFISSGVLSMHYVGMEAMVMHASIQYNLWIVAASVLIAFTASYTALQLFIYFSKTENLHIISGPILSSVVMGIAIAGMHYTGMASATFTSTMQSTGMHAIAGLNQTVIGYLIVAAMLLSLFLVLLHVYYDRRLVSTTKELQLSDRLYKTIVHTANDAIIMADASGHILSWNAAAETFFGYTKEEALHQPLSIIMPAASREAHHAGMRRFHATGEKRVIDQTVELQGQHKNGTIFPLELSLSVVKSSSDVYFTGIIRNITDRKEQQERIQKLVYIDELTDLPNRRMIHEQLAQTVRNAEQKQETIAVGFIDMDRFKQVNDVYGHQIGDALLREMSARMRTILHPKDILGRQSGDEFIWIASDCSAFEMSGKARKLMTLFDQPFMIEGIELFISPSIGISMYPDDSSDSEELIKNADVAMYFSKQLGGRQFQFFTPKINEQIATKMYLESGLRKAIELEEFVVFYQPQVSVLDNRIIGVEALIRWESKELGRVSPMDFIPLAEETNLINPIGEWVLRKSCSDFMEWERAGKSVQSLSVNISAIQFQQEGFVPLVKRVLRETAMDPTRLVLEVTESVLQNVDKALPVLHQLKAMGVKLSLDDFGTGYSSLQYLKDFPLDCLKIDKSFVQSILTSSRNQAVVDTIITMAERLEMSIVAEGVETIEQLDYLAKKDQVSYQGYLYSPPVPYDELMLRVNEEQVG